MYSKRLSPPAFRGFTLIELMITVVVLAILITIAVPSFTSTILSGRLSSLSNELVASAHLARGEAIKRNAVVTMCVSTDGANCTAGDWHQGWIVACLTSDNTACDPAGGSWLVFHRQGALPNGMRVTEAASAGEIDFQPAGVGASSVALTLCRATPSAGHQERVITISPTGRPSVAKTTNGACP